ncbi:MAG: hypothetical protein R2932_22245 [Caldilineaceae bacterium]
MRRTYQRQSSRNCFEPDPDRSRDMPTGVRVEKWDANSIDGWGHLIDGADAVVNLAGAGIAGRPGPRSENM